MQPVDALLSKLNKNLSETSPDQLGAKLCEIAGAMSGSIARLSPDQLAQYDMMLCRFAADIEALALSKLSFILSTAESGPSNMITMLAKHDDIVVAGPVLADSPMLDESLLCEIVRCQSQMHLQAVCDRASLSEPVSSTLLEHGDDETTILLARNLGARFSNQGFAKLVERAHTNETLALTVGNRGDVPAPHLEVLIRAASDHVRTKLVEDNPKIESIVKSAVADATREVTNKAPQMATELTRAQERVADLYRTGKLDTNAILEFATRRAPNETLIAMALLCRIDAGAAFRAINESGTDIAVMMAKTCELTPNDARTVLLALKSGIPRVDIDRAMSSYARLKPETARSILKLRTQPQTRDVPLTAAKTH